MPSRLNSKIYFDHAANNELLIYSVAKSLKRPINTVGKNMVGIGSSSMNPTFFWQSVIEDHSGAIANCKYYNGSRLSMDFLSRLQADLAATPTLLSAADIILLQGGVNDHVLGVSENNFLTGAGVLWNYIREHAPNAYIMVLGHMELWNSN